AIQKSNFAAVGFPQRNRLIKRELAGSEITQLRDPGLSVRQRYRGGICTSRCSQDSCRCRSETRLSIPKVWRFLAHLLIYHIDKERYDDRGNRLECAYVGF